VPRTDVKQNRKELTKIASLNSCCVRTQKQQQAWTLDSTVNRMIVCKKATSQCVTWTSTLNATLRHNAAHSCKTLKKTAHRTQTLMLTSSQQTAQLYVQTQHADCGLQLLYWGLHVVYTDLDRHALNPADVREKRSCSTSAKSLFRLRWTRHINNG